jgi:hypothetical protein
VAGRAPAITGMVVTADALHTQRAHTTCLHERGAFSMCHVRADQPDLFEYLLRLDRDLAIALRRPVGRASLAAPTQHMAADPRDALQLLGLT